MKTHIIRLESHDDVTSIRDKISWSRAARILLVFPKARAPHLSAVDLNLIMRQSSQLGGQLGLVARDREIGAWARELSIPVFATIPQAQRSPWLLAHRKKRLMLRPGQLDRVLALREKIQPGSRQPAPTWVRMAFFGLGFAALLALVLFFLPNATVTISPQNVAQEITLKVWAKPDLPGPIASGGMPAQVQSIVVEGSADAQTSAVVSVPDQQAKGFLRLTNLTEIEVSVPEGTVFASANGEIIRFTSTKQVTVPGGVGKTTDVEIEARLPGSLSNLPAGAITAVEGPIGLLVTATNPEPTTGGADREARAASEQDFNLLYDSLYTRLSETALLKMGELAGDANMVVLSSLKVKEILRDERTPQAGQPAEIVHMDLKIEFSALTIKNEDVHSVARLSLDAGLPAGYTPESTAITVTNQTDPALDSDGISRWEVTAAREISPTLDEQTLVSRIVGQPLSRAESLIAEQLKLESKPEISLSPTWWGRMPYIPFRIRLVLK